MLEWCVEQTHVQWRACASWQQSRCHISEQQIAVNSAVDAYYPQMTEMCYLPQVGTQRDVISDQGIMLHWFFAAKCHVGDWCFSTQHGVLFPKKLLGQWAGQRCGDPTQRIPHRSLLCGEETSGESSFLNGGLLCTTSRNNLGLFVEPFAQMHRLPLPEVLCIQSQNHACYCRPNESSIWHVEYKSF